MTTAGAFGGLLSVRAPLIIQAGGCHDAFQAAISNMDGVGGEPAWYEGS